LMLCDTLILLAVMAINSIVYYSVE
jgi:hypothetical protein